MCNCFEDFDDDLQPARDLVNFCRVGVVNHDYQGKRRTVVFTCAHGKQRTIPVFPICVEEWLWSAKFPEVIEEETRASTAG